MNDLYTLLVALTVLDVVRTIAFCAVAIMAGVYLWNQRAQRITRDTERRIGAVLAIAGAIVGILYVAA